MKKINLAITGCMGRMGQKLIKSSKLDKSFKIVTLTENKIINKKINGIKPTINSYEAFKKVNVIIDFTVPKSTLSMIKIASKLKHRILSNILMIINQVKTKIMSSSPKCFLAKFGFKIYKNVQVYVYCISISLPV